MSPPPPSFQYWTDSLGLSSRLAKRVYQAFTQTSDPKARAFVFALERLFDAATIKPLWLARYGALVQGPGSPEKIVACLEKGVRCRLLTRREANDVEEAVLRGVGPGGQYL
jgi:hypothetical protein